MRVTLDEVCTKATSKYAQKDLANMTGEYPVFGASGFIKNIGMYQQEKTYVAVVKDGAGIGRTMLLPGKSSVIGTMQYLLPKENIIPKFLYYAVKSMHLEKYYTGATIPHIYFKDYKKETFDLPKDIRQKEIINILDKVELIIRSRKLQLNALDELIKSRFVEMFGDPVRNEKKWIKGNMQSICIRITDGEHGSVPRSEIGHPFLNAKHIKPDGTIDWKTTTFVANEVHEKIYRRCNPETGDILVTTTGTIGNVVIVPDTEPFSMDRGITLLKLQKEKISSIFIAWLLKFDSIQEIMNANIHASAIGHLFLNKVKQLPVIIPPLELQNEFSSFVIQVDKSRLLFKCQLLQYHSIEHIIRGRNYG